ncbi:MAG: hypothetical protein ACM3WQ_01860 [Chloroflexota bacterium]
MTPQTQTHTVGEQAQIGATFYYIASNGSIPLANQTIVFFVVGGPNQNVSATALTTAQGQATFNYTGLVPGIDTVRARNTAFTVFSNDVTVTWVGLPNVIPEVPFGTIMIVAVMTGCSGFYLMSKRRKKV